jgi:uncharacterized protein YjdB
MSAATTISANADVIPTSTVIYGYTGSTAESYATTYNRAFISLNVTGVSLNETNKTLNVGETFNLTVITQPVGENISKTWSPNNNSVATVDSSGMVTAVAAGSATITASTPVVFIPQAAQSP